MPRKPKPPVDPPPEVGDDEGAKNINFRAPGDLVERLVAASKGLGLDVSNFVRMVLYENLPTYEDRVKQLHQRKQPGTCQNP
jgi:hypothetical protein